MNGDILFRPDEGHWRNLLDNCLRTPEDLAHINRYPFAGMRVPNGMALVNFLRHLDSVWVIQDHGAVAGFINFGEVIAGHANAFGMLVGLNYCGRGLGGRALAEFVRRRGEWGIEVLCGYCHRENRPMIRIMEKNGFTLDASFSDSRDLNAARFTLGP